MQYVIFSGHNHFPVNHKRLIFSNIVSELPLKGILIHYTNEFEQVILTLTIL